jgi:hypothetical protein
VDERLNILLEQYDGVWRMFRERLNGLTDKEYFWEPAPACYSIRPRGKAASNMPHGAGGLLIDRDRPPLDPPTLTTIAWRLGHIAMWEMMRYDHTFDEHTLTVDDITWPSGALEAIDFLERSHERWRGAVSQMSAEELDQVGRSQMPHGWDPKVRFIDLLAWTNTEYTHHAAEVGCMRDLYRALVVTE